MSVNHIASVAIHVPLVIISATFLLCRGAAEMSWGGSCRAGARRREWLCSPLAVRGGCCSCWLRRRVSGKQPRQASLKCWHTDVHIPTLKWQCTRQSSRKMLAKVGKASHLFVYLNIGPVVEGESNTNLVCGPHVPLVGARLRHTLPSRNDNLTRLAPQWSDFESNVRLHKIEIEVRPNWQIWCLACLNLPQPSCNSSAR